METTEIIISPEQTERFNKLAREFCLRAGIAFDIERLAREVFALGLVTLEGETKRLPKVSHAALKTAHRFARSKGLRLFLQKV